MRLWITGIGVVSPLAATARETMDRLCLGHRAFAPVSLFDVTGLRTNFAAEVRDFPVRDVLPCSDDGRVWSRTDAFAIVAAEHALREAKLATKAQTIDLIAGTTTGATLETEQFMPDLLVDASVEKLTSAIVNPLSLMVDNLRKALGPFRHTRMVSSACSTGASALLLAGCWLRSGLSECVLVGASDALCRLTYCGFHSLGSLDPEPCRPFDRTRAGLSLGEAAAFLVVETEEHARARGVEPIVELAGWAALSEAHHITNPESTGRIAAQTMKNALACAGIEPSMVDYVNAHATATVLHDPMELRAMRAAFDTHYDDVLVSSTKGQLGHTLAAAGVLEVAVCAMAIAQSRVPPTAGLTDPADDCQASHVIGSCVARPIRVALSNSFGFGGLDASIVVAHPDFRDALTRRDGAKQSSPSHHNARFTHRTTPRKDSSVWVHRAAVAQHDGIRTVPSTAPSAASSPTLSDVSVTNGSWPVCSQQGAVSAAVTERLNPAKARRLQRAECLLTSVVDAVLGGCDGVRQDDGDTLFQAKQTGLVAGRLSGNPDAISVFLDRIRNLGPRFASPADFPNLMLSSMAGHVAIYCKLHGITLATSSMTSPGCAAIATAVEMVQSGYPDRIVIGAVERWGMLTKAQCEQTDVRGETGAAGAADCEHGSKVDTAHDEASRNERSSHQAHDRGAWLRTEGAAAIVVDSDPKQAIARMDLFGPLGSDADNGRDIEQAPIPAPMSPSDCIIRVANTSCQWVAVGVWANAPIVDIEAFVGVNEASEVAALVMGVELIDTGKCERVLVVMQGDDGIVVACVEKP